ARALGPDRGRGRPRDWNAVAFGDGPSGAATRGSAAFGRVGDDRAPPARDREPARTAARDHRPAPRPHAALAAAGGAGGRQRPRAGDGGAGAAGGGGGAAGAVRRGRPRGAEAARAAQRAAAGRAEPPHQRARRDAARRRHPRGHARARRRGRGGGRRHGLRHRRPRAQARLRPVRHHEGSGARHRARAVHLRADRPRPRRTHRRGERGGARQHVPRRPAPRARGRVGPGGASVTPARPAVLVADDDPSKTVRLDAIKRAVRRTLEVQRLARDNQRYRRELRERFDPDRLVGHSPEIVAIYKLVARVAALDTTVLIQGETGTGKELVARAIHYAGPRADRPFVVIDCAAIPEPLFESELFGHERGAFTGAVVTRRGLLETAQGGTCFLDEISELSGALQAKLLRVLQDRVLRRVGGNDPIPVDVRLVAATNRDLKKRV